MKRVAFRAGLMCALMLGVCGMAQSVIAQDEPPLPLAEAGPYASGYMLAEYPDAARENREVRLLILYPAVQGTSAQQRRNAEPDRSGAPYPLILTGYNDASMANWQLAEHGFVVAAIRDALPVEVYNDDLVDFPRDLVFALEQLASDPPEGLAGLIDTDHTGVLGYSWDGYGALSVSGARIDPAYYQSQCGDHELADRGYPVWWNDYACALADDWDAFATHAGPAVTTSSDDLWQPITDARIRAVAPLAPEGALIFGPRGLAAADRPTLIMIGTEDDPGQVVEAVSIYEYLGSPDKAMISFIGQDHMAMVMSEAAFARMRHFVTAFFGYHLQGQDAYADFYSQTFVAPFDDLVWGPYTGE